MTAPLRNAEILAALAVDREIAHLHSQLDALELRADLRRIDNERIDKLALAKWHARQPLSSTEWGVWTRTWYQHERQWQPQKARA